MKKIIAILAMVALVGGVAFAEGSFSGSVISTVNVFESDTSDGTDGKIFGSGGFNQVRIQAQGQDEEGKFGAWIRVGDGVGSAIAGGHVWWKPIDQFLLRMGSNVWDGFWAKDGYTCWMFYQTATDTGVTFQGANAWGGTNYGDFMGFSAANYRSAFWGGLGSNALMMEIKPVEMFGINIGIPYFEDSYSKEVQDVFGGIVFQADVNLDFGNIALTYIGPGPREPKVKVPGTPGTWAIDQEDGVVKQTGGTDPVYDGYLDNATNGQIFLYFGLKAIENVELDIGLGTTLAGEQKDFPVNVGAGAKITINEQFGLKARVVAGVPTDDSKVTTVLFDVLPYFALSDSMTVFVSVGLGLIDVDGEAITGFHFNPYLQVGSEWGPKFLAGIKVWQNYAYEGKHGNGEDAVINWAIPIALNVGF